MKKLWIGIDQSYSDTGIAICVDGEIVYVGDEDFEGCATKHDKRCKLRSRLERTIARFKGKYAVSVCLEAVRLFSGATPHISTAYIFSACAMIGMIVDACASLEVPVYWVETRSWKSQVLGSSKPSGRKLEGIKDKQKVDSVRHVISLGLEDKIKTITKKGIIKYNDNRADAVCIAICGSRKNKIKNKQDF